jgi:hypothetical protein
VEVLSRAEAKSPSLSESFDIDSSSAGLRASIRDWMNLPVFSMNVLFELLLIDLSNAHLLPGVC